MKIQFKNVNKLYKAKNSTNTIEALNNVSFDVNTSEIFCLIGPSGCGKSTIINLLAGFIFPDQGEILVDGKSITSPSPNRTVVFQEHALFPWKTVRENIEFGLKCKNLNKNIINDEVDELLKKVKLTAFANCYPDELSSGMKQRVAIARAFAIKPDVILMDEPFASLDQQNRDILQEELLNIQAELKQTIIFVTHNIDEALFLGDKILLLGDRPARVKSMINVPFNKPRSPDVRNTPPFVELKHKIWHLLREETF